MLCVFGLWKADAPRGESAWIEDLFFEELCIHMHSWNLRSVFQ